MVLSTRHLSRLYCIPAGLNARRARGADRPRCPPDDRLQELLKGGLQMGFVVSQESILPEEAGVE
jgi:hypothetical protein